MKRKSTSSMKNHQHAEKNLKDDDDHHTTTAAVEDDDDDNNDDNDKSSSVSSNSGADDNDSHHDDDHQQSDLESLHDNGDNENDDDDDVDDDDGNYRFDDDMNKIDDDQDDDDDTLIENTKDDDTEQKDEPIPKKRKKIHQLSLEKTTNFNEILKQRGVIYIASIPHRMTPSKIKTLLSGYGCEITRVYLQEEDPFLKKQRMYQKQNNTNNKNNPKKSIHRTKRYTEGWIEFEKKSIAKHVARSLHQTPITNYKRSVHCDILWTMKYLSSFQWNHLTEKVAYERRVREQKIRLETLQARKETNQYKQSIINGTKQNYIEQRFLQRQQQVQQQKSSGGDNNNNNNNGEKQNISSGMNKKNNHHNKKYTTKQLKPLTEGTDKSAKYELLSALMK